MLEVIGDFDKYLTEYTGKNMEVGLRQATKEILVALKVKKKVQLVHSIHNLKGFQVTPTTKVCC